MVKESVVLLCRYGGCTDDMEDRQALGKGASDAT